MKMKTEKPHGKLIYADALIESITIDPVECPGCPEPEYLGEIIELLKEAPDADAVPWEVLERYADHFCAQVSFPEFVREAKRFYRQCCGDLEE